MDRLNENEVEALSQYRHIIESELLQDDLSVSQSEGFGLRALHIVSRAGEVNVAKMLLSKGANVNFKTKKGLTPLHYAVLSGKTDIVQLLLLFGAKPDEKALHDGKTPLHMAASRGDLEVVRCLLDSGANVSIPDFSETLPKDTALSAGFEKCSCLLEHHEQIQSRAAPGVTRVYIPEMEEDNEADTSKLLDHSDDVHETSKLLT